MRTSGGNSRMNFGERVTNLRRKRRITQTELAKVMEVSRMTIVNYEVGYRIPQLNFVIKIAAYFGVTLDYIAGLTE